MSVAFVKETRDPKAWKRNKYGAKGVRDPEHGYFHSRHEFSEFCKLLIRVRTGEVRNLKRQVPYDLNVNGIIVGRIIMDFTYDELEPTKQQLWFHVDHDAKGMQTAESKLQHKLFAAIFGREIRTS